MSQTNRLGIIQRWSIHILDVLELWSTDHDDIWQKYRTCRVSCSEIPVCPACRLLPVCVAQPGSSAPPPVKIAMEAIEPVPVHVNPPTPNQTSECEYSTYLSVVRLKDSNNNKSLLILKNLCQCFSLQFVHFWISWLTFFAILVVFWRWISGRRYQHHAAWFRTLDQVLGSRCSFKAW